MSDLRDKLIESLGTLANTIADAIEGAEEDTELNGDEVKEGLEEEMVEDALSQERAAGKNRKHEKVFLERIGE